VVCELAGNHNSAVFGSHVNKAFQGEEMMLTNAVDGEEKKRLMSFHWV
jgi:hypothetical protein